jgi:Fungal specific transcription factor domain
VIDERGSALVEYCLFFFLPSQYHQAADGESTIDLSYLRYMCLESRVLLNAVSACALVSSHKELANNSQEPPQKLYMNAISEISTGIAQGSLTGTEDYLLATVLWLCVYEVRVRYRLPFSFPFSLQCLNISIRFVLRRYLLPYADEVEQNCRVEALRQSSIHAAALRRILLLREPMNSNSTSTSQLVWERMCVEAYIYHSAVTTLFDGQLNLIEDTLMVLKKFQDRKSDESPASSSEVDVYQPNEIDTQQKSVIQSPVLGAPYHMFLFLMEGIRLVRTISPGYVTDEIIVWSRYYEVHRMQFTLETDYACYNDSRRWIGKLYAVAIRLLFLYIVSVLGYGSTNASEICSVWYTEMECTLSEARNLLIATEDDIDRTWGKFFLWPLAIIGAMIYDEHGISLVNSWLYRVVKKSNSSSALVIRKVLEERIWNHANLNPSLNGASEVYTRGLSIMFNTDIMNHAATSLMNGKTAFTYQEI